MSLKPVVLERIIQSKVWGGHNLADLFGIRAPDGEPVGETWELFDRPDGGSAIRGGGTLRELMTKERRALLGRDVAPGHGGRFPLLFKFLDAQTSLSVQVHPDDAQAAPFGDGGKSEAWVVLRTLADARIVRGFVPGASRDEFENAVRDRDGPRVESMLHQFRPQQGDCIDVPARTVHAIGPGVVIFEVQQNSDITYRLYDWGRNRSIHIEEGLGVYDLDDGSVQPTVPPRQLPDGGRLMLRNPFFRMRRYTVQQKTELATEGAFLVVTVFGGRGTLGWHSGGLDLPIRLEAGDCVLIPACVPAVYLSPIGQLDVALTDCSKS